MKKIKIILNSLMLLFLIVSFFNWHFNIIFHITTGSLFIVSILIHVILNIRWIKGVTKAIIQGKSKTKVKLQFTVNLIMTLAWLLCFIMGIITAAGILGNIVIGFKSERIHIISAIVAAVLVIVHMVQHRKRLVSLFKKKPSSINQ